MPAGRVISQVGFDSVLPGSLRSFGLHRHCASAQKVFDAAVQENIATFGQEVKPECSKPSLPAQYLCRSDSGDCRPKRRLRTQWQSLSCRSGPITSDRQVSQHLPSHPDFITYCRVLTCLKW